MRLPIVLIPGFMADATLWDDLLPDLQALGPIAHADLSRVASIGEMAHDVLAAAPARFAVVGFSMGGYVAREVARLAPERVQALVLVATSARADTPAQKRRKAFAVNTVNPAHFTGLSRGAVLSSLHPDRAGDAAMVERVRAMSERVGGEVFVRHATPERASDLEQLAAIQCPTLVIAADHDALRSQKEAHELREGIRGATLTLIEGSGHMIPIEQPAALAAVMVCWLREHARP
ncbi:alpha/beta hydrolase [Methylobacterium terrae]|uniref:Alpha/beta hydrolase n=1 Tax=Methylobacterium terrae TaxID=2202827 RepID=A0A2U8WFG7_9HYPH|nr:alpha/beta hydrolase [Methylobacterium terrae]AWN44917.1 alpha/beta hydrolase [Methylobacterium terrae]